MPAEQMANPPGLQISPREAIRAAVDRELEETHETKCTPPPIPDHDLLHGIGRGAYGEVWLARNALGRLRAVKVVYRARFEDDRPYEREFNGILKYEPISRSHEGLIQVLHVGRNDQARCFYYVMELADNLHGEEASANPTIGTYSPRTLRAELWRRQRLPPKEAAELVLRLAGALLHLHTRGLVHRDIKPSNVIYIGGSPKLADIGLVTDVGSSRSFVGTEGFIPPEGPGTPQADIYSLGKVLYELATGLDRMEFPQLPPGVAQLPDGEALLELNEVMTRACAPDPQQRYASATELLAELNLFLAGRSLRHARNIERHLARLKPIALGACLFFALATTALWFSKREEWHAREQARVADESARNEAALRHRAEGAEHEARQQLYTALLEQARATVRSGELGQRVHALDAIRRAASISRNVELRREVFAAIALPDLRFEREFSAAPDATFVEFDPQFQRFALGHGRADVEIRSASDQRLLRSLPASSNLRAYYARWSVDGRFLLVARDLTPAGDRKDIEVWELTAELAARQILLVREAGFGSAFHPSLAQMAVGLPTAAVAIWDLEDGTELARWNLPARAGYLEYSRDGKKCAVSYDHDGGGFVSIHATKSPEAGEAILVSKRLPHGVTMLDWHPNGRWIALSGDNGSVNLVDAQTGEFRTLGHHKSNAVLVRFSPDGEYLVSGGWDREFIFWDLQATRRAFTASLDSFNLQFHRDAAECAVVTRSQSVQLYRFERPVSHREFGEDLGGRVGRAAFSGDGRWLAASGRKGLGLWDLTQRAPGAVASEASEARPYFTPEGSKLFGSSLVNDCFAWRIVSASNGAAPRLQPIELRKPTGLTSLCLVSNSLVWTGTRGSQVVPLDQVDAEEENWGRTYEGVTGASPDGRWLGVFRPFTASVYVYQLPGLQRVAKLTHEANITTFRFSPTGDEVAIASRQSVEFWSTSTWRRTRTLTNFGAILYATDARSLWLTKDDRAAGLFSAHTLEPLLWLPTGMLPLALSPDGRHLAVSIDTRRLQLWDLAAVRKQLAELVLDWTDP
jgi:WD40 repeat protein